MSEENFDKAFLGEGQKVLELDTDAFRYWEIQGKGVLYRKKAW